MRSVDFLKRDFDNRVASSLRFVRAMERNRLAYTEIDRISSIMIDDIYELAFLRIFGFWESFLEEVFKRLLCGYEVRGSQEQLVAGQAYSSTVFDAEARILNGRRYVSWYVPSDVVGRCRRFFSASDFEHVIASANLLLNDQGITRHQIAHVQTHATAQFDTMTMRLVGRRFRGSRPGKFLRSLEPPSTQFWLDRFAGQLMGLAGQIAA